MPVNFPDQEIINYERDIQVGAKASEILISEEWIWIEKFILGALQDLAVNTLKIARTEEDRMKAQQQFLAAHKPKEMLESLIRSGIAAKEQLREISTLEGENNG